MAKMDEQEIKALLAEEIRSAILFDSTELSDDRADAMEYYQGEMNDTPSAPNRSKVVSRDVADIIGWMLPGIIRIFTASDRMAVYEPEKPNDEEGAKQATDYINHVFWKDNDGYRNIWDATHDSLLQKNGIIKHYWDDSEQCEYSEHSGMTEMQLAMLMQEEGVEILAQKQSESGDVELVQGPEGQVIEQPVIVYDIKVKRVTSRGRLVIECIEPENFLKDAQSTTIPGSRFCAHRDPRKTRSDLVEMGFDKDIVEGLPADSMMSSFNEAELAREEDRTVLGHFTGDRSMEYVELFECYVKADVDGDGVAETIRAYYAGRAGSGELLDWEVWDDDYPFSDIPCEPVPHRWEARSIADETMDMQRIKTVLLRQALDNLYASNVPQREMEQDSVINMDEMLSPTFGGTIIRKKGSTPLIPHSVPFVADKTFTALEYFDQVLERRTGVSRSTMALDPETLQNQTATASNNQKDSAYSQVELVARNQAELGWKRVFKQILRLVVKHQDRARTIRLRDEWVEIDPRYWNANMDVTINVGLGTGSRDRDMAMLNNILQTQIGLAERFASTGFIDKAIDMLPRIIETMRKIAESAGIRNPDAYYPMIDEDELAAMKEEAKQRASQPDPKVQMEQAKMQADQANQQNQLQLDVQKTQAQLQLDQVKAQQDSELKREQMQLDAQLKREQLVMEMNLKREQLEAELQLKREQMGAELELKREMGYVGGLAKVGSAAVSSSVHPGGEPG